MLVVGALRGSGVHLGVVVPREEVGAGRSVLEEANQPCGEGLLGVPECLAKVVGRRSDDDGFPAMRTSPWKASGDALSQIATIWMCGQEKGRFHCAPASTKRSSMYFCIRGVKSMSQSVTTAADSLSRAGRSHCRGARTDRSDARMGRIGLNFAERLKLICAGARRCEVDAFIVKAATGRPLLSSP